MHPPEDLSKWIKEKLFHAVPMGISVIDQHFNVIYANQRFQDMFGEWQSRKCYDVYKNRDSLCRDCKGSKTFQDGLPRINEEVGYNKEGKPTRYIKHTAPVVDDAGNIPYLIEMSTDITEAAQIRQEYELLFDHIPCGILLIDRNFRILKANRHMRELIGDPEGKRCYRGLKGLDDTCEECTARQTFEDGRQHFGHHVWKSRTGETFHMHVVTIPIRMEGGRVEVVMEMAVDVSQTVKLEEGLKYAHTFLKTIITNSMNGIFAVDKDDNLTLLNPTATTLLGLPENHAVSWADISAILPKDLVKTTPAGKIPTLIPDTAIRNFQGRELPVRLFGNQLRIDGDYHGMAFSMTDLSELKQLEREKLEAGRLAAVGQTVAGLAHGVKNLVHALEGGMYMLNTGVGKGDVDRVTQGMDILSRNIDRIGEFVKAFLDFSKRRELHTDLHQPESIAEEVIHMFAPKAEAEGITLGGEHDKHMAPAPLDYEKIHECLTNLVGNAMDACRSVENPPGGRVTLKTYEKNEAIVYEVVDNGGGMDDEAKQKVFTTIFTTKGLSGTGLGLLMTQKIIQEHGGRIEFSSKPGRGTTFSILLPRKRLSELNSKG